MRGRANRRLRTDKIIAHALFCKMQKLVRRVLLRLFRKVGVIYRFDANRKDKATNEKQTTIYCGGFNRLNTNRTRP